MIDLRPVLWGIGFLLSAFALMMLLPACADLAVGNGEWQMFLAVAGLCFFAGLVLVMGNWRQGSQPWTIRQIILLANFGWLALALAGAVTLMVTSAHLSLTDAVFEATSGITATGSTVLRHLDQASPGLLLWRSLLQWMGGIGVLTLGVVVLPELSIGGTQLFRVETGGRGDRLARRAARLLAGVLGIYLFLTLFLFVLLWVAGMDPFPALLQAMSTISCGGFSSSNSSIGHWRNAGVDWVILLGMLLGGGPFLVYWQALRRQSGGIFGRGQIGWYLGLIAAFSCAIALWLVIEQGAKPLPALRHSLFAVASVMTGTGYATLDWGRWTGFPLAMLFLVTFIGGCAGSTSGGLKVFRIQVLLTNARLELLRFLRPHAVLTAEIDDRPVSDKVAESVLGFLFVYTLSFALLAMALALAGMSFMPALASAASALANLGPAVSPAIGPLGNFALIPPAAKWLLAGAMLFGRLELFLVLALFGRNFWRD
jgi:trk system potassium uptake protein TrkH